MTADGWPWLHQIIAHWDEFGAKHGFAELIDRASDALIQRDAVRLTNKQKWDALTRSSED